MASTTSENRKRNEKKSTEQEEAHFCACACMRLSRLFYAWDAISFTTMAAGPFPFTLYAVKLVGPLATASQRLF